jgi:hypothetical protein
MTAQSSILIGVPCLDYLKVATVTSLFEAAAQLSVPAALHIFQSSLVHDARNKIVQRAIDGGFSHLMFVDSDIKFPGTAIEQLYQHNLDIVGGLYFRKAPPHYPTFSQLTGKKITFPQAFPHKKLFEVFGIGTGFLMIKTAVLKDLTYPWFFYGQFHKQYMGEDIYFARKARAKKYQVWCDPTIQLSHIGEYEYNIKDYELYQETKPDLSVDEVWDAI